MLDKKMPGSGIVKRKGIDLTQTHLIKETEGFPLVIELVVEDLNFSTLVENHRFFIESALTKYGAIILRNGNLKSAVDFDRALKAISPDTLAYKERSSPRSQISGHIYTSTDHPSDQSTFLHNEQSYNLNTASQRKGR